MRNLTTSLVLVAAGILSAAAESPFGAQVVDYARIMSSERQRGS